MPEQLAYHWVGDRTKPTIAFLHGFLGCGIDFFDIATGLSDRYSSLLIDLPGHGASLIEDDESYGMAQTAALVVRLFDQLNLGAIDLYGYSMGGRLALYLTLTYPDLIHRTILESASPGLPTAVAQQQRQFHDQAIAQKLLTLPFSAFLNDWYLQPLFQSLQQSSNFATLHQRRLQNHPEFLAKSLLGMGTGHQPSLWAALANRDRPLHLLAGANDEKFCQIQTAMQQIAPNSITLSVIQQTGHNIHWENPTAVIREIAKFFA
jgi:2-succinyl-6-hydroxy-2,4-cyclohexadiene-1-carboxylate synthase